MTTFAICTPRHDMTCGSCHLLLWDCSCPRSIKCRCCELDPDEAEFVNPDMCEFSLSGHEWIDENGDEVKPLAASPVVRCMTCDVVRTPENANGSHDFELDDA